MNEVKEQCIYVCGPYKGYFGKAEFDPAANLFHGEVVGVRDVVTFQGRNPAKLKQAFCDSVDDYLAFCKSRNEAPEKPFSGKFLMRVEPEMHRQLAALAEVSQKSLNQLICDFLTPLVHSPVAPRVNLPEGMK